MKPALSFAFFVAATSALFAQAPLPLRPPATPLIAHDPYWSVWSFGDKLTDENTKHWTGTEQPMLGLARIDGQTFRFMGGRPRGPQPAPVMPQVGRQVLPTRTVYDFEAAGLRLSLTFFTPAFPENLDVMSRPVTYLTWEARSIDQKPHALAVYFDVAGQMVTNTPEQQINISFHKIAGQPVLRMGTTEQPVLGKYGDNLRIDWGYLYVMAPGGGNTQLAATNRTAREQFMSEGKLPDTDDLDLPRAVNARSTPLMAARLDFGNVATTPVKRGLLLAYDDLYSIQLFQRNLRPYWRRNGMGIAELLQTAAREYQSLDDQGQRFDRDLMAKLTQAGGPEYAALSNLAFRQTLAAHKLVADIDGTPLYFSKENFSNGCIDTVDVTYPSAPFFLYFNPELLKAQLTPVMDYASLPRWKFPFAPHDLGTYPLANGQVYGGGESNEINQMPVEESGNLLILVGALAKSEKNAAYAKKYWPVLTKWADYLRVKGLDPENQLSTDDFAGHLAHNTNLSLKAILALGSYAMLADQIGERATATTYRKAAEEMAARWEPMALDGDHYKLAFDKSGTWSQKYNLVWDKLLGLKLFPASIAKREMAYYKTRMQPYGLPLDNREQYTKLDWEVWTAALSDNRQDFQAMIKPLYKWTNETPTRVPLSDWYWTHDGKQRGFQARSVVGGVFLPALGDKWDVLYTK